MFGNGIPISCLVYLFLSETYTQIHLLIYNARGEKKK